MSIPRKLERFLDKYHVDYEVRVHPAAFTGSETAEADRVPGREFAKVVILNADEKLIMAVIPASHSVDLLKLASVLGADNVRLAQEREFQPFFPDCELGAMPPFGRLYSLPCYVDGLLLDCDVILFNGGTHRETVRLFTEDFLQIARPEVGDFSVPGHKLAGSETPFET